MRRLMLRMSQTELGGQVGVTFQQVQKYESGTNQISVSRLQQIADVLQVPAPFFFEGSDEVSSESTSEERLSSWDHVVEFMTTKEGLDLANAFMRIKGSGLRRLLVNLVEELAE